MSQVSRWGNSAAVRLPPAAMREVGMTLGTRVKIEARDGFLAILPARSRLTMDELLEGMTPELMRDATDWDFGPDVGQEKID